MKKLVCFLLILALLVVSPRHLFADGDDAKLASSGTGPFGLLNPDSKYYQDVFPEPFRVEDTAIDNELRFDWEHDERKGVTSDGLTAEVERSFGILTFEIQAPYLVASGGAGGEIDDGGGGGNASGNVEGFGTVQLGGRFPVYQYVSKGGFFDDSIGLNFEAGIPTNSRISKNSDLSVGAFTDLAIGERFSIQALFSVTSLLGPTTAGRQSFEYGLAFAYAIEDEDFKLPHVERLIPIVELFGDTALNGRTAGHDALTGTAGIRIESKPIGKVQPQFGGGYIFPIDAGGREELRWGIITSLTFEF